MDLIPIVSGLSVGAGYVAYAYFKKSNKKKRNNLSDRVIKHKKQQLAIQNRLKGMF